jgi:hypothetical protein
MPIAKCTNCGQITNSAVSNYILDTEIDGKTSKECGVVTSCYAAFVDEKWVKGCGYNYISPIIKVLVDLFLSKQGV